MATRSANKMRKQVDEDLLTRTSWVNSELAYMLLQTGKIDGNKYALWERMHLQYWLFRVGCFIQHHAVKVMCVGLLVLYLCSIGLITVYIETSVEKLWVEEGGRLGKELAYTTKTIGEGTESTHELLIQTPKVEDLLSPESMSAHLSAVAKATDIMIQYKDKHGGAITKWKFKDLCYGVSFPSFSSSIPSFDTLINKLLPCIVITPLDCFWDGAKIHGPKEPLEFPLVGPTKWTNLNPIGIIKKLRNLNINLGISAIFKRAGISTGYLEKPCLDPSDPECPDLAPNKLSQQAPDVAAELTGGCTGFAANVMQWEEDLIVGGVTRDKYGNITKAQALQTILQLLGKKTLYEKHKGKEKVEKIEWSVDVAEKIIHAWQRAYTKKMDKIPRVNRSSEFFSFSVTSLTDLLISFSSISYLRVSLGYILMLLYACVSLVSCHNPVNSQSTVGMLGVLLVALSVAAGLGICSLLGISSNATTTQIIPFLALGLGVDHMFLVVYTYAENFKNDKILLSERTGDCLRRVGVSVLITSSANMLAFFSAAIIPIPALRAFSLQAGILVLFNIFTVLLIFPAIVSIDLRRREAKRVDFLCCLHEKNIRARKQASPSATPSIPNTLRPQVSWLPDQDDTLHDTEYVKDTNRCPRWSLSTLVSQYYAPFLQKRPVKIVVFVAFTALLSLGIWGSVNVRDGLELTDLVPRNTTTYEFLERQQKYFSFFQVYAVTNGDFDYTSDHNQKLLRDYHRAFKKVDKILKKDGGSLPPFWLDMFQQWLVGLQMEFDKDAKLFNETGWHNNATDDAILAYKLLAQSGNDKTPIKRSQVHSKRLVSSTGIINPAAFYNYLTAWTSIDSIAYTSSLADFHPKPRQWSHDREETDATIPKSSHLAFAQISFFIYDVGEIEDMVATVTEMRSICDKFATRGLPNYPRGIPFTFWEQYLKLRIYLMAALLLILGVTFIVIATVLMNALIALIVVGMLASITVELFGFMGFVGIKLSAVPAVILIISVGIGVEFTVHICIGFVTSIGSKDHRMLMALRNTVSPVVNGAVSTFLGIIMLAGAEFDFIVKYFFNVLAVLMLLGMLNGLVLLPVILSVIGPRAEVVPRDGSNHIQTPERENDNGVGPPPLSMIPEETTQYSTVYREFTVDQVPSSSSSSSDSKIKHIEPNTSVKASTHTSPPMSRRNTPTYDNTRPCKNTNEQVDTGNRGS